MDATLPFLILYACLSVLLFLWDAKHGLLPDRFTCPLLWSGLLFSQVCNPDGLKEDREKGYRPTAKNELHARSIGSLHNEEGRVICLN